MSKQTIPVVDLRDFYSDSPSAKQTFVDTVGGALTDVGFFAIENHGVDAGIIDKAYGLARKLFDLPEAEKRKYEKPESNGQRGYASFGREHAKDNPHPDLKEFWQIGQEASEGKAIQNAYHGNIWPVEFPEFKNVFVNLFQSTERTAMALLQACALYIGEPENFFKDMATQGNSILRVIHYPPVPKDAHPKSVRSAAHEDINLITLLCESTDAGLELLRRDGTWMPIHALSGQIVADAGDMLQNVTNGLYKSTTHRVVNPDNDRSRRFSMPCFIHPRSEVDLSPLASCVAQTGGVEKFPHITAGEYLDQRLREIGLKY